MQKSNGKKFSILVVEDNKPDVFLVREALDARGIAYELHHVEDGDKAIDFIRQCDQQESAPCPDLLLLDMNLPKREGDEVLRETKRSRSCCEVPVIIFTSSDSPADRERVAALGATRYFRKPSDLDEFMVLGAIVQELLTSE